MIIYNYLFYHIYELALRSKSNKDAPMLIVMPVITVCLMFNVGAMLFLLQGLGLFGGTNFFSKETRLIAVVIFGGVVSGYYLIKGHYKSIYSRLKAKYTKPPKTWYSIIVVLTYYLLSFCILLLTALYKNQDWIFAITND